MAPRHSDLARGSRLSMLLLISGTLVISGGCSHRRSALRPVYGTPVSSPVIVMPSTPGRVMSAEPDPSEPLLSPIPSTSSAGTGDSVTRAGTSPPVPMAADEEPALNLQSTPTKVPPPSSDPVDPSSPELTRPSTARPSSARSNKGTKIVPLPTSTSSSVERVKPFLATPSDLFQPAKADRPWKYVVLHHSASATGSYDQIDRDHRKILGYEGCGYHFVIGNGSESPDGQIEVSDRWINQKQGVHCRNAKSAEANEYGIGICLIGNFDQTAPTPKQVAAAAALVAYLENHYRITSNHSGTHDQFADSPTACPGKNFPREAILGSSPLAAR